MNLMSNKSDVNYGRRNYYNLGLLSCLPFFFSYWPLLLSVCFIILRMATRYDYAILGERLVNIVKTLDIVSLLIFVFSLVSIPNALLILKYAEGIYVYTLTKDAILTRHLWGKTMSFKWDQVTSVHLANLRNPYKSNILITFKNGCQLTACGFLLELEWKKFLEDVCAHVPREKITFS